MNVVKAYPLFRSITGIICCVLLFGCARTVDTFDGERKLFGISVRDHAPQPVYKRTRLVHLPSVVPPTPQDLGRAPMILPVVHFELVDASLEDAARILGQTSRYTSYCASTIADKRVTLTALGTIDELASKISTLANIETIVDHHNREVRFLARKGDQVVAPQLY